MTLDLLKIQQINDNFEQYKNNYIQLESEYKQLNNILTTNIQNLKDCNDNDKLYNESKKIINNVILNIRDKSLKFIEDVITGALKEVFNDKKLELKLELNSENIKTSVSIYIKENDELFDLDSRGGGLRDIVSFGFLICIRRLVNIQLPLLCDESFKFINSTDENVYNRNAFKFIKTVCEKLNEQIIFITGKINKDAMEFADKIIYVEQKDGISYLR